jgi:ABC-2 type transport system ATP-binding protein
MTYNGALLEVEGVSKQYQGSLWANQGVSLSARAGEVLGILGPNGAGKTTLVRQITTELLPSSGSIHVLGINVVKQPLLAKSVMGIVPQEAALYGMLSVEQIFGIFAKFRGIPRRLVRSRVDTLLNEMRLEEHRKKLAAHLSSGLQRRVMVGIATLTRPHLMVLDEPTAGLDPQSRRDLWALLRRLRDEGSAILLTTHYMEEAEALCDRVGIMQHGQLLAMNTVPNLRATLGYEYKITYVLEGSEAVTEYGSNDHDLVEHARSKGAHRYSIDKTSLEDVFLALTDGKEALGGTI